MAPQSVSRPSPATGQNHGLLADPRFIQYLVLPPAASRTESRTLFRWPMFDYTRQRASPGCDRMHHPVSKLVQTPPSCYCMRHDPAGNSGRFLKIDVSLASVRTNIGRLRTKPSACYGEASRLWDWRTPAVDRSRLCGLGLFLARSHECLTHLPDDSPCPKLPPNQHHRLNNRASLAFSWLRQPR